MFLTKRDVDKHCQEVMSKCKNEKDRNLRCLNLAQQYYNVRDYESAKRYIISFLSVKDDSPVAHKLFAQCLEYFGEKEKALSEFKYSLSLDPKQPELYLKVCELYADNSIVVDKNEAKYWHDKAEAQFPYHPAVHKLKKKMFAIGDSHNGMSFESILLDEVKEKPKDATVNAKLLNFYIDNGRFREAYDQAFKKKIGFVPNLSWYQSCVQVCKSYRSQFPTSLNEEFYGNYLLTLERCLALSVQDVKMRRVSIPEGVELLASFDEALSETTDLSNKSDRLLLILNHFHGQLCFHTAHILYRKAKWEDNNWPEMIKLISPLLLLCTASRFDIRRAKEEGPLSQILKICILNNFNRIQQAGYILTALVKQSPKHFFEKIFHFCVSDYWKERICEIIYNTSNLKTFSKTSFFMKFDGFSSIPDELPKNVTDHIDQFLSVCETLYPSSLHHLVWIGVQYLNISIKNSICDAVLPLKFTVKCIGSLQFSPNSSSSYAENLSKIDIEAFLFACVYCAKSLLDHQIDKNKPLGSFILPADVSRQLCSPEQDLWWDYVHHMINQTIAEEHYSRARATIQRGIENIRLTRRQVLPVHLLVLLGRTFANKATVESDSVRASELETRSVLYWKAALPMLEKILQKESYLTPSKSIFEYQESIITTADASKLIAEGKRFMGMVNCKEKNYCDSIFLNETLEESVPGASISFSQAAQSTHSVDDTLLKTVLEQNTKIMDKLETLFNKQELLSSNQFQLFETISALSKKIDDVLIMPNDCYLDALSASEQPTSPLASSQVTNTNVNTKPAPAVPAQPLIGSGLYPLPSGVQTNYPMFQPFCNAPPLAPSTFPFLSQYLQTPPQVSSQNFQFVPDTKESYSTTNRSIASSSLFGTNTAPTSTPARGQSSFSSAAPFEETSIHTTPGPFTSPNLFQPAFSNSIKPSEVPVTTSTSFSFSFPSKTSFFQQVSSSPISLTVASVAPHPFQVPNVPNPLFPSVQVPEDEDSDSDEYPTEHDPIPDFKPIIPLPDEVKVTTGEEGEEVLFENRAKLFRFVEKEWKERGVGPIKILKNRANSRVRILMRREVVHKICANHFLLESMNLVAKGDCAWVYCAMDFADEETRDESLCVKFKTPEIANEFYRVFNENKMSGTKTTTEKPLSQQTPVASPMSKPTTPASSSPLAAAVGDGAKKIVIAPPVLSVQTAKEKAAEPSKTQFGGFTFSAQPILSAAVEKKEQTVVDDKKKPPFASFSGFSLSSLARTDGESKLFSTPAVTSVASSAVQPLAPALAKNDKGAMMFTAAENALDFSNLSKNADGNAFAKSKDFKGFAGAGAPVFGGKAQTKPDDKSSSVPASSALKSSPGQAASTPKAAESTQDESNDGEYVPTAEFTPVIPLPDLIEVKTGEEGMEILYEEHCKLFRFTDEQWKERGIGKMKILRDPKDGTIRMLMRRDQVHKVCCNQRLTSNHELKPLTTTDKAWSWVGKDFSEGELKDELLCVRFKTVELAAAFRDAFDNAKARLSEMPAPNVSSTATDSALPPLSQMYKRDQSMWECKECYVTNKKDDTTCVACQQPKDGVAKVEPAKSSFGASGGSSLSSFSFNSAAATTTAATGFSFGTPAASTTWSFGVSAPSTATAFSFGTSTSSAAAGAKATTVVNSSQNSAPNSFSFGNLQSQKSESGGLLFSNNSFMFGDKSAPPSKGAGSVVESPPEKKSASDANVTMFGGVGGNSFNKSAQGSSAFSSFSFKLPDKSNDDSFGVKGLKVASEENKIDSSVSKSPSPDDVVFVSETNTSEDEKLLATSLMLPPNYFAYKYSNNNCPGCVGCDEEDKKTVGKEVNKSRPKESPKVADLSASAKISNTSTPTSNPAKTESAGFSFGGLTNSTPGSSWLNNKSSFNFGNIFNQSVNVSVSESTPKKAEEEDESDSEDKDTVAPNENDIHFEPIVPLPNLVETKTGEEDELIEFCERSRLFRYDVDNKEWKERGIGECKILFHPTQKSYRLLLRREQVHKVVLNQRITSSFDLKPLSSNAKSWCWFGMNLPEESSEPVLEQLAIRFKNEEVANTFGSVVSQCIERLNDDQGAENTAEVAGSDASTAPEEHEYEVEEGDEYYGEEYDESYEGQRYYVDEQELQDAMTELIFDGPASLTICEGNVSSDYNGGVVRLMKGNLDGAEVEHLKSYLHFSTPDVPSLYITEINKDSDSLWENDRITILEDPQGERKVTVKFPDKESCENFYSLLESIQENDTS